MEGGRIFVSERVKWTTCRTSDCYVNAATANLGVSTVAVALADITFQAHDTVTTYAIIGCVHFRSHLYNLL